MLPVWLADYKRRLEGCFKKLKFEQSNLSYNRFYLITKCGELRSINPDWKPLVFLFLMHHSSIDPDDHMVIHYLRWLQS